MSLGTKLMQSAQKEAALQRPFPLQAHASEALPKGGELKAEAQFSDADRLTKLATVVSVSLERPEGSPRSAKPINVEERAQSFCEKATYLTERLQFVETDVGGTAKVRSTPETMAGRRTAYFEADIGENEICLRRYQPKPQGAGRESVPFALSDDLLNRLVEDAANVLAPKR